MAGILTGRTLTVTGARVAAVVAVCGVALTGCASPGGGASTHNDVSRCAAVLPTARDLMHGQGRLVLVRPVKQSDIDTIVRDAGQPAAPASPTPPSSAPASSTPASAAPASSAPASSAPAPTGEHPAGPTASAPTGAPHRAQAPRPQEPRPHEPHPEGAHAPGTHPQGGHPGTPGRAPRLCLVAYQGSFRADAVPGAQPAGATGTYALVFLWVRHPRVDRTLITDVLPASAHRPWWHF